MKKKTVFMIVFTIIFMVLVFCGCTENYMARTYGGTLDVNVEPGYKVTSATWKESDLFYFIEPMEEGYIPKEKKFIESSSFGVLESTVVFKETKNK